MKSPFPGMDPFIEVRKWGDFHHALIEDISRALSATMPRGYIATTEERSYIALAVGEEKQEHEFYPDVKITGPRAEQASSSSTALAVFPESADLEPVELRAELENQFVETFIDIYELHLERRLVTSIEVLSPSNKRVGSETRGTYLRKRQALLMGEANLVEIDLLRGGTRMPMRDKWPKCPYTLLVARKEQSPRDLEQLTPRCTVWPAFFDRPLPTIPVPLTKRHAAVPLDLQPLIDAIYVQKRYAEQIDYNQPLDPPLSQAHQEWLQERLSARETPSKPARKRKSKTKR